MAAAPRRPPRAVPALAPATITVASFPDLDRAVKTALPLWEKLYPQVKVKLVSLQIDDHHNSMTTALAAGARLPDVMAIDFRYVGSFAESKGMEDLLQPPYGAGQYRAQFVPFTFVQATSSRGTLGAMPADLGPGTLFYRKDLMDKAGIKEADLTHSWESYIAAGKKLKAATGTYLLAGASDLADIVYPRQSEGWRRHLFWRQGAGAGRLAPLRESLRTGQGGARGRHRRAHRGLDGRMGRRLQTRQGGQPDDGFLAQRPPGQVAGAGFRRPVARGELAGRRAGVVWRLLLRHPEKGQPTRRKPGNSSSS